MKLLSWNYQVVRSPLVVLSLKDMCRKYDPYFIFLMETKNKEKLE